MFPLLAFTGVTSFCTEMQVKNIDFRWRQCGHLETEKEMLTQHIINVERNKQNKFERKGQSVTAQNLIVSD